MHRHFFVRSAGLLGFAGFLGFAALREPSSSAMAVEGGKADVADNTLGFTVSQMKTSLGSSEAIGNRPSWLLLRPKGEAQNPSMVDKKEEGFNFGAFKYNRREAIRNVQEGLDALKAVNSKEEAQMYEIKSRSFGSLEIWRRYEEGVSRRREMIQTLQGYLDELRGLQDSLEAVIAEQMKMSPESSAYHALDQRKEDLEKQENLCLENLVRMIPEVGEINSATSAQLDEVLFGMHMTKESTLV